MIGLDVHKSAETLFGQWSWRVLAAASFSAFFGFFLTDAVLKETRSIQIIGAQRQHGERPVGVLLRWRDRQDPRSFVSADEINLNRQEFGLAWIAGSSITVRAKKDWHKFRGNSAYELSDVFAFRNVKINGKPLRVHEYYIDAARTGDMRRAALHAANDPLIDAIIFDVSPIWALNSIPTYMESNQRASIFSLHGYSPKDVLIGLRFTRPSSILAAMLAPRSKIVRDRYALSTFMPRSKTLPYPLISEPHPADTRYPSISAFIKPSAPAPKDFNKKYANHRNALLRQDLRTDGLPAQFLCLTMNSFANSGKPTLLYSAPLAEDARRDPEIQEFMKRWTTTVETISQNCGGPNILLLTEMWQIESSKIKHRDMIHLRYGQGEVEEIEKALTDGLSLKLKQKRNNNDK